MYINFVLKWCECSRLQILMNWKCVWWLQLFLRRSSATSHAYLDCKVSSLKGESNRLQGQNYKTEELVGLSWSRFETRKGVGAWGVWAVRPWRWQAGSTTTWPRQGRSGDGGRANPETPEPQLYLRGEDFLVKSVVSLSRIFWRDHFVSSSSGNALF